MKKQIFLLTALFFISSFAQAECKKVLHTDRLDFGVKTGLQEYDCPSAADPIADKIQRYESKQFDTGDLSQNPSALSQNLRGDPELSSSMALIVDESTGEIIYAKNAESRTSIASITKLMTAMVTLDARLPLNEKIIISNDDIDRVKGTRSRLSIGLALTRRELLHLALMSSENRAAAALARSYPGGTHAFVAAMNRKAARLGMLNTQFADSSGLRSENQSTAEDLARMVRVAHTYPIIQELTTASSYDLQMPIYKRARSLAHKKLVLRNVAFRNTNKLVNEKDWQIGVSKTGFISEAGHCLVMQATIANHPLIIVLLDAAGKYTRIDDAVRVKRWLESAVKKPFHNS
jgi:D-alanyl-D-alanine endopeptidase (penicillin-binding protein 7)